MTSTSLQKEAMWLAAAKTPPANTSEPSYFVAITFSLGVLPIGST
jgi:hypothetical protein